MIPLNSLILLDMNVSVQAPYGRQWNKLISPLQKTFLGILFFLDVAAVAQQGAGTVCSISKAAVKQILPMNGRYSARAYLQTGRCFSVQVNILEMVIEVSADDVAAFPLTAEASIYKLEFIQKE